MATKKSKVPVRRYPSDDLEVVMGADRYRPHEGEWVEMRGGPSWDFMRDAAAITRRESQPFNTMTAEESRAIERSLERLIEFLASRVVSWSWTDPDGKPLPSPSAEVLGALDQQEVLWLIATLTSGATPTAAQESEKNV